MPTPELPMTVWFNLVGMVDFPQAALVDGVANFQGYGIRASSDISIDLDTDILVAFDVFYDGMVAEIVTTGPVPLEYDTAGIMRLVEINDSNALGFADGSPSPFTPQNVYLQAEGEPGQWFGDYVVINGQYLNWADGDYHNELEYGAGRIEGAPSDKQNTDNGIEFYVEDDGQYMFITAKPTGTAGAWEWDESTIDGPYNYVGDELYEGPSPMPTPSLDYMVAYGDGPGWTPPPPPLTGDRYPGAPLNESADLKPSSEPPVPDWTFEGNPNP